MVNRFRSKSWTSLDCYAFKAVARSQVGKKLVNNGMENMKSYDQWWTVTVEISGG